LKSNQKVDLIIIESLFQGMKAVLHCHVHAICFPKLKSNISERVSKIGFSV